MPTQHIETLLGATCCVRLATLLRHVATCWVLLAQISTTLTFEISSWSSSRLNARKEIPYLCAPCIILYWFLQLQCTTWYHWTVIFSNVCVISPGLSLTIYPMLPPSFLTWFELRISMTRRTNRKLVYLLWSAQTWNLSPVCLSAKSILRTHL